LAKEGDFVNHSEVIQVTIKEKYSSVGGIRFLLRCPERRCDQFILSIVSVKYPCPKVILTTVLSSKAIYEVGFPYTT
jgi:hypothetical protein